MIVVGAETPEVNEDRVLVISDCSFNSDGSIADPTMMSIMMGREGDTVLVNGEVQPTGTTAHGNLERWRIVNACVARYVDLRVVGAKAQLLGFDGRKEAKTANIGNFILAPGNRADLLVTVDSNEVSLNYTTVAHPDAGMMMQSKQYKNYPLFALKAEGSATTANPQLKFAPMPDLRMAWSGKREFVLAMPGMGQMMGGMGHMHGGATGFTINGESFDMQKVNTHVSNNSVEEWTITNTTTMQHPFHLHIWPMQLVMVAGKPVAEVTYCDVVNVPAKSSVKVLVNFTTYTGKTLYHCHILDHEDQGMMGAIESA